MNVNSENLEKAIKAALEGPEERDLRIADYRFNIKPATILQEGNTTSIVGGEDNYISRRRRGRPNDRIFYEINKSGDKILDIDVEIARGGLMAIMPRYGDQIKKALENAKKIYEFIKDQREKAGDTRFLALSAAQAAASVELQHVLDGTWEGEAYFLVSNIALQAEH